MAIKRSDHLLLSCFSPAENNGEMLGANCDLMKIGLEASCYPLPIVHADHYHGMQGSYLIVRGGENTGLILVPLYNYQSDLVIITFSHHQDRLALLHQHQQY